ncbi:hypothetical protein [Actinomadura rudentiformis]|uniref:hypothetical protein n=1 Tax=Actinomadura rudentiformis TaxID=359158 RepID=UPI00124D9795|nr:hypothetical protein [Actinomadura rudentiformis]
MPIPPELVKVLREHLDEYGAGPDGRLFRTYRGGVYQPSTLWQVLGKARPKALTAAQVKTPQGWSPGSLAGAWVDALGAIPRMFREW